MEHEDGMQHLRDEVAQLDWPIFFMRVPEATMERFMKMTAEVEGDLLAKFEYLMNEAGWGE